MKQEIAANCRESAEILISIGLNRAKGVDSTSGEGCTKNHLLRLLTGRTYPESFERLSSLERIVGVGGGS